MPTNFKRTFGNATSPLALSYLDDNFAQLEASGTSTVSLSGAQLIGFMQSGSGTDESVQSRLRWQVLITDYLSVADRASVRAGTTVNIDTALSSAHSALPTNGGDIIFPPGSYKVTATPSFTKRVKLIGAGISESAASTGTTVIVKDAAMTTVCVSLAVAGSEIEGIEIQGENGNTGDGIEIKAGRCALRNVASYSMGGVGIRVGTDAGTENCNLWYMERVKAKSNGSHGIYIHDGSGTSDVNGGTLVHPDVQSNTGDGIRLGSADLNTIIGGAVQSNTGAGVRFTADANNNILLGGDIEGNAAASDVVTTSGGTDNTIINASLDNANCTFGESQGRVEIANRIIVPVGIGFPATQVASSNANTLDDYEEGTFTPAVAGTVSAGTGTYTTQIGAYTKIGNRVHFQIVLVWTAHDGSGNTKLTGLPFTSAGSGQGRTNFVPLLENFTYGAGIPQIFLADSATEVNLYLQTSGAGVAAIALDTAGSIYVSGTYKSA
jgi:hypothetical protein